jgi:hypothetical protein
MRARARECTCVGARACESVRVRVRLRVRHIVHVRVAVSRGEVVKGAWRRRGGVAVREAWRRKAGLRGAPVEPQRDGKVKVASAWNDNGFNIRPGLRCSVQRGRWGGGGGGDGKRNECQDAGGESTERKK